MKEEEYTEVPCATCDLDIATLDSIGNADSGNYLDITECVDIFPII